MMILVLAISGYSPVACLAFASTADAVAHLNGLGIFSNDHDDVFRYDVNGMPLSEDFWRTAPLFTSYYDGNGGIDGLVLREVPLGTPFAHWYS